MAVNLEDIKSLFGEESVAPPASGVSLEDISALFSGEQQDIPDTMTGDRYYLPEDYSVRPEDYGVRPSVTTPAAQPTLPPELEPQPAPRRTPLVYAPPEEESPVLGPNEPTRIDFEKEGVKPMVVTPLERDYGGVEIPEHINVKDRRWQERLVGTYAAGEQLIEKGVADIYGKQFNPWQDLSGDDLRVWEERYNRGDKIMDELGISKDYNARKWAQWIGYLTPAEEKKIREKHGDEGVQDVVARLMAVASEKAKENITKFEEKAKSSGEFAELVDPLWLRADEVVDKINELEEKGLKDDSGFIQRAASAIRRGNGGSFVDILGTRAMLSDNEDAIKQAVGLRKQWQEVATAEREKVKGTLNNILDGAIEMAPMMGKSMALSAIPGVGQYLSAAMWAQQGAGSIFLDLKEAGISTDVARKIAINAGVMYALVEQAQVGAIQHMGQKGLLNAILRDKIKKAITRGVATGVTTYVTENIEELAQGAIEEWSVEVGKYLDGKQEFDASKMWKDYWRTDPNNPGTGWRTLKETMGPMAIYSLLGLGGMGARAGVSKVADRISETPIETYVRQEEESQRKFEKEFGRAAKKAVAESRAKQPAPEVKEPVSLSQDEDYGITPATATPPVPAPAATPAAVVETKEPAPETGPTPETTPVPGQQEPTPETTPTPRVEVPRFRSKEEVRVWMREVSKIPEDQITDEDVESNWKKYREPILGISPDPQLEIGEARKYIRNTTGIPESMLDDKIDVSPFVDEYREKQSRVLQGKERDAFVATDDIQNIIHPEIQYEQLAAEATDPKTKAAHERLARVLKDKELQNVYSKDAEDEVKQSFSKKKIPYTVVEFDGRNLTGANTFFGDDKPLVNKKVLIPIWNDIYAKKVSDVGGIMIRYGGDEFRAFIPHITDVDATVLMNEAHEEALAKAKELGIDKLPAEKSKQDEADYRGVPVGSGTFDFGAAMVEGGDLAALDDARLIANQRAYSMKHRNIERAAVENGWNVLVGKDGKVVKFEREKSVEESGPVTTDEPTREVGKAGKEQGQVSGDVSTRAPEMAEPVKDIERGETYIEEGRKEAAKLQYVLSMDDAKTISNTGVKISPVEIEFVPAESRAQKAIERLGKAIGRKVVFFRGDNRYAGTILLKRSNALFINADAKTPNLITFFHESVHQLSESNPALAKRLDDFIYSNLRDDWMERYYDTLVKRVGEDAANEIFNDGNLDDATIKNIFEEYKADFLMSHSTDADFWKRVHRNASGVLKALIKIFDDIIMTIRGLAKYEMYREEYNSYLDDAIAVRDAMIDALIEEGKPVTERKPVEEVVPEADIDEVIDVTTPALAQVDRYDTKIRSLLENTTQKPVTGRNPEPQGKNITSKDYINWAKNEKDHGVFTAPMENFMPNRDGLAIAFHAKNNPSFEEKSGDEILTAKSHPDRLSIFNAKPNGTIEPVGHWSFTSKEDAYLWALREGFNYDTSEQIKFQREERGEPAEKEEKPAKPTSRPAGPQTLPGVIKKGTGQANPKGMLSRYLTAQQMEKQIRSLRGHAVWRHVKFDQLVEDRARINGLLELAGHITEEQDLAGEIKDLKLSEAKLKAEFINELQSLVRDYAAQVGYHGRIAENSIIKAKTIHQLNNRLEMIDRYAYKKYQSSIMQKGRRVAKQLKKRLGRVRAGKDKQKFTAESADYIESFIGWMNGEHEPMVAERLMFKKDNGNKLTADEEKFLRIWTEMEMKPDELSQEDLEWFLLKSRPRPEAIEAKEVAVAINQALEVYKKGKTIRQAYIEAEKEKSVKKVGEIVSGISKTIKGGIPEKGQVFEEARKETERQRKESRNIIDAIKSVPSTILTPETIGEFFTDNYYLLGMDKGAVSKYIVDELIDAASKQAVGIQEHAKRMRDTFSAVDKTSYDKNILDENGEPVKISYVVYDKEGNPTGRASDTITLTEAMHIYANSKNAKNRSHLESTGVDILTIAEIAEVLPAEAREAVDSWIDFYDNEMYPRVSEIFQRTYGIPMSKESNYFPIMRLDIARSDNNTIVDLMQRSGTLPMSVYKKFVKMRTGSKAPFRDFNFWRTIGQHMRHTEHYIAFEEPVNRVRPIMDNPDVKDAMRAKDEQLYRRLNEWTRELSSNEREREMQGWEDVFDNIVRNYSIFALGINPRVMLKQLGSLPLGTVYSRNPGLVLRYATQFVTDNSNIVDTVLEKSDFMRGRLTRMNSEMEDFRKSKEFAEMSGATKGEKIRADIQDALMGGIRGLDAAAVYPLWMASYHHQRFNLNKSEKQSVKYADTVIARTQPAGGKEHLPSIMRQKGFVRMLTMFKNILNKQTNIAFMLNRAVRYADIPKDKKAAMVMANAMAMMVSGMYMYLIDRAFIRGLLAIPKRFGEGAEEVKDDIGTVAKYMADQVFGGFIVAGDAAGYTIQLANNEFRESKGLKAINVYEPTHALAFEEVLVNAGKAAINAGKIAGNISDKEYEDALKNSVPVLDFLVETGGLMTGLVPSFAYRAAKGALRVENLDITDTEGPLNIFWSQGVLEDRSMKSAMASRLVKPKSYGDKVVFLKWYESLPEKRQENFDAWLEDRVLEDPPKNVPGKKPTAEQLIKRYRASMMISPSALPDPSKPLKKLAKPKPYMPTVRDNGMILHGSGPLASYGNKAMAIYQKKQEELFSEKEYKDALEQLRRREDRFIEELRGIGVKIIPNTYTPKKEK